jgi:ceramide glucosyltransferase
MGSTIALRRETLERIGGFLVFRDALADDYAIGSAVRALGLKSVVAPVLVSHSCSETNFRSLVEHELRWANTIKGVDFAGHAGSIVTHPLALAVLSLLLLGVSGAPLGVLALSLIARIGLMAAVDHVTGRGNEGWWLAPARDAVSFAVFVASFFTRSVRWRGRRFRVTANGEMVPN